jgi:hypothetical protein
MSHSMIVVSDIMSSFKTPSSAIRIIHNMLATTSLGMGTYQHFRCCSLVTDIFNEGGFEGNYLER